MHIWQNDAKMKLGIGHVHHCKRVYTNRGPSLNSNDDEYSRDIGPVNTELTNPPSKGS